MFSLQKKLTPTQGWPAVVFNVIKYIVITALWIFVIMHAFNMDITNDEAYSFFLIKTNHYRAMPGTANTHWLNSFFIKIFTVFFGDRPGILRLHSVFSFPFFAFGIFRLCGLMNNKSTQLVCCFIILFNPFVLDYFSMARGYAMAITLQVWLIIFLIDAVVCARFQYRKWLCVILLALLMTGANLSYFYSAAGAACVFFILLLRPLFAGYSVNEKEVRVIAFLFFALLLITIGDLLFIKYYGRDLGYGGNHDFAGSLAGSVWQGSLYFSTYPLYVQPVLTYSFFTLLIFSIVYLVAQAFKKNFFTGDLVIAMPVIAILILTLLFHLLFNTPYLYGRTALQLLPAGILLIFIFIDRVSFKIKMKMYLPMVVKTVFIVATVFHFCRQANTHYCFEWRTQADAENALCDLSALNARHPAINNALMAVFINYYSIINKKFAQLAPGIADEVKMKTCMPADIKKISQSDFVIAAGANTLDCMERSGISYLIIKEYKYSSAKLIKINAP